MGQVRGPHGEKPPGPGWWLASDYQWYPPDARPGEMWGDPIARRDPLGAGRPPRVPAAVRPERPVRAVRTARPEPAVAVNRPGSVFARTDVALAMIGLLLIAVGVVLLATIRLRVPDAGTAVRLLAWSPVAVGSAVTLLGALRYLEPAR